MRLALGIFKLSILAGLLLVVSCGNADVRPKSSEYGSLFLEIKKLAEQGNPQAQYHLGMMYNNGAGVPQDPVKAFEWFQKGADGGDPLAAFKLGCYFNGQFPGVVTVDHAKSLEYNLIAANAGYSLAQEEAGDEYIQQANRVEALKWLTLAAQQGNPSALYNLSVLYREGDGIPKDSVLSYSYFKLAQLVSRQRITPTAQASLDELAISMTPEELRKAEQIVSEWKPQPTALTKRAANGLEEVRRLVEDSHGPE